MKRLLLALMLLAPQAVMAAGTPGVDVNVQVATETAQDARHYDPSDFSEPYVGYYTAYASGVWGDPYYTFAGEAYGYANLRTGTLKAAAWSQGEVAVESYQCPCGSDARSTVSLSDTIYMVDPVIDYYTVGFDVDFDGYTAGTFPFFGQLGEASLTVRVSANGQTLAELYYAERNGQVTASNLFNFIADDHGWRGDYFLVPNKFDVSMTLEAHAANGGVADFSHTAVLRLNSLEGTYTSTSGLFPGSEPVPEPASWMLMITGIGLAGWTLRRFNGAAADRGRSAAI